MKPTFQQNTQKTVFVGIMLQLIFAMGCGTSELSEKVTCDEASGDTVELATNKLYIEFNATDDDIGVHGAFDGEAYSELCIYDPSGNQILGLKPQNQLLDLTISGIFFESREPPAEEYDFDDLRTDFPEGEYTIRATTYDGASMTGAATFTHTVPAAPTITAPALAEDEETAADAEVAISSLEVAWDDVTETTTGAAVTITGYEVIITKEVEDDPNGFSRPTYDVHVTADVNSLDVPEDFLEADTVYELEVLALEESGNQTISVGFFKTQ
jgi:hypothetical protein